MNDEPDATGGIIPYTNSAALIAYYCGVFSIMPGSASWPEACSEYWGWS